MSERPDQDEHRGRRHERHEQPGVKTCPGRPRLRRAAGEEPARVWSGCALSGGRPRCCRPRSRARGAPTVVLLAAAEHLFLELWRVAAQSDRTLPTTGATTRYPRTADTGSEQRSLVRGADTPHHAAGSAGWRVRPAAFSALERSPGGPAGPCTADCGGPGRSVTCRMTDSPGTLKTCVRVGLSNMRTATSCQPRLPANQCDDLQPVGKGCRCASTEALVEQRALVGDHQPVVPRSRRHNRGRRRAPGAACSKAAPAWSSVPSPPGQGGEGPTTVVAQEVLCAGEASQDRVQPDRTLDIPVGHPQVALAGREVVQRRDALVEHVLPATPRPAR